MSMDSSLDRAARSPFSLSRDEMIALLDIEDVYEFLSNNFTLLQNSTTGNDEQLAVFD